MNAKPTNYLTDTLIGRNLLFNYLGLIASLIVYCQQQHDASMTGWYFTFAVIPIVILPQLNRYMLIKKVWPSNKPSTQRMYTLFYPALFFMVYLASMEKVVLYMTLSMTFVNVITYLIYTGNHHSDK